MAKLTVTELISDIFQNSIETKLHGYSAYRSFVIQLPSNTDGKELEKAITNIPLKDKRLRLLSNTYDPNTEIAVGQNGDIVFHEDPNNFSLYFYSTHGKPMNSDQTVIVLYREYNEEKKSLYQERKLGSKYLIVLSFFPMIIRQVREGVIEASQIVEHGLLMRNCTAVIEETKAYFDSKQIDISENIKSAQFFANKLASADKPMSRLLAALIIIGFMTFLVLGWFLLIKVL